MIKSGNYVNMCDFVQGNDMSNKIMRIWYDDGKVMELDELGRKHIRYAYLDEFCDYVYITQVIQLPNDIMLGVQEYCPSSPGKRFGAVDYVLLSRVKLMYYECDQDKN